MNQTSASITIHNLDPLLYSALREQAESASLSLNRFIKNLLTQSLGLTKQSKVADFSEFSHQWSQEDLEEFQASQTDFSTINPVDWQ